jgi:hypothetical protein
MQQVIEKQEVLLGCCESGQPAGSRIRPWFGGCQEAVMHIFVHRLRG